MVCVPFRASPPSPSFLPISTNNNKEISIFIRTRFRDDEKGKEREREGSLFWRILMSEITLINEQILWKNSLGTKVSNYLIVVLNHLGVVYRASSLCRAPVLFFFPHVLRTHIHSFICAMYICVRNEKKGNIYGSLLAWTVFFPFAGAGCVCVCVCVCVCAVHAC